MRWSDAVDVAEVWRLNPGRMQDPKKLELELELGTMCALVICTLYLPWQAPDKVWMWRQP